jgi:hypothetical protein
VQSREIAVCDDARLTCASPDPRAAATDVEVRDGGALGHGVHAEITATDGTEERMMSANVTDEQIQELAATAKPYSLAVLSWGPERHMEGAAAIELEHQRRLVSLRLDGVISVLCPVASDTTCGIAILTVPLEEARGIMDGDPCVQAGMMRVEVYQCHGFPGDTLPA